MNERRRPPRRGRGPRPNSRSGGETGDNPYREEGDNGGGSEIDAGTASRDEGPPSEPMPRAERSQSTDTAPPAAPAPAAPPSDNGTYAPAQDQSQQTAPYSQNPNRDRGDRNDRNDRGPRNDRNDRNDRGDRNDRNGGMDRNGRRHRRGRGRGPRQDNNQRQPGPGGGGQPQQPLQIVATTETRGWFDIARDAGFIRRPNNSYLAENGDAYVPPHIVRQHALRKSDLIDATVGIDPRGRATVVEIRTINGEDPATAAKRPDFNSLPASYPERKLFMETGRPAKGGHELTRRAIDLIAPIGYGQRALIVAPARAGKTTLLHAITEGVAINHPNAALLILLVDERPEEVSEAISWGVGEVVSSSFDQPAQRHVEVTEMVLNRAHRLVEAGKDVVIVLDSLTRMARAHNTAERGTGRTLSGGLDATAMAKPKAFFGSARSIPQTSGGGSLTIIATALVETGSRMDDVIFEEFKCTGNS